MNAELPFAGRNPFFLEAKGLAVARGNRVVFHDVNLTLSGGEIVALVGCNGAGKTTLLQCLAGALRPARGEVFWLGEKFRKSPAARKLVGLVGHESGLYLALTVWENLLFAARMWGIDAPETVATNWLAQVGLQEHTARSAAQLSRGMRQRLAIARALIHDPPIILLDEPFTSLDSEGRKRLTALLCNLRERNFAVMLATHELGASDSFDRLVNLRTDGLHEVQPVPDAPRDCVVGGRPLRAPQSETCIEAA